MRIRTLLWIVLLLLVAVFVGLNWTSIVARTPVHLGFAIVSAPLGLILLGILGTLAAALSVSLAMVRRAATLEARRSAQKLEAQRELAEAAEASRFTQLDQRLEAELRAQASRDEQLRRELLERMDRMETGIRAATRRELEPGEMETRAG